MTTPLLVVIVLLSLLLVSCTAPFLQSDPALTTLEPPPIFVVPAGTVQEDLRQLGEFETLITWLELSGIADAINAGARMTIFAPPDDVFDRWPDAVLETIVNDPKLLDEFLANHVLFDLASFELLQFPWGNELETTRGTTVPLSADGRIASASVTSADNTAGYARVHVVDAFVLVPVLSQPTMDDSGVDTFYGTDLSVFGTGAVGSTILVELNREPYGSTTPASDEGWFVPGKVTAGDYEIWAFMLDERGFPQGEYGPINLRVE